MRGRAIRGLGAYHAGLAAEEQVAERYRRQGLTICARRWRGRSGEIDLIARDGGQVVFIEVKQSATHARAAENLSPRQIGRLCRAASEFLARDDRGQETDCRFDLALVDGQGKIEILGNAIFA